MRPGGVVLVDEPAFAQRKQRPKSIPPGMNSDGNPMRATTTTTTTTTAITKTITVTTKTNTIAYNYH